jgi:hypothetical protein
MFCERILSALHKASRIAQTLLFSPKMVAAMFVETLGSSEHSVGLTPESRSCTLNSVA